MKSFAKLCKEILIDAFVQFRSPTATTLCANRPPITENCKDDKSKSDVRHVDGKSWLDLAMSRLDKEDERRSFSLGKAYQILAFNVAVTVATGTALFDHVAELPRRVKWVIVSLAILQIYVGTKSAIHCLRAIVPRAVSAISPKEIKSAVDGVTGGNTANNTEEQLKLVASIAKVYNQNEEQRAIMAEHTWIATHGSIVQVLFVGLLLAVAIIGRAIQHNK